eukprot:PhF_6_TR29375/c0_g2_i1/m.43261
MSSHRRRPLTCDPNPVHKYPNNVYEEGLRSLMLNPTGRLAIICTMFTPPSVQQSYDQMHSSIYDVLRIDKSKRYSKAEWDARRSCLGCVCPLTNHVLQDIQRQALLIRQRNVTITTPSVPHPFTSGVDVSAMYSGASFPIHQESDHSRRHCEYQNYQKVLVLDPKSNVLHLGSIVLPSSSSTTTTEAVHSATTSKLFVRMMNGSSTKDHKVDINLVMPLQTIPSPVFVPDKITSNSVEQWGTITKQMGNVLAQWRLGGSNLTTTDHDNMFTHKRIKFESETETQCECQSFRSEFQQLLLQEAKLFAAKNSDVVDDDDDDEHQFAEDIRVELTALDVLEQSLNTVTRVAGIRMPMMHPSVIRMLVLSIIVQLTKHDETHSKNAKESLFRHMHA